MKDKKKCTYDPLTELINYYSDVKKEEKPEEVRASLSVEEKLKNRIINGDKTGIEKDIEEARKKYTAIDIINNILLEGMKVVGELFGSGQMQLPFVLQSAECMKTSVKYLEQYMEKTENHANKGTMVLATVKGDVHDIGKNLVDIILTNNGYKVINLGIKCPVEAMISAYHEHKADAIGMSGLLVKSTAIMKENLEVLNERGVKTIVILGGAALTRRFVEDELKQIYKGNVYYANDAFGGLKYMEEIMRKKSNHFGGEISSEEQNSSARGDRKSVRISSKVTDEKKRSDVRTDIQVPIPPFFGCKIVDKISIDLVFEYINETALFKGNWNIYRDKTKSEEYYRELLKNEIYPKFSEIKLVAKREKILVPQVIYGYYPCCSEGDTLVIYKPKGISENDLYEEWEIKPSRVINEGAISDLEEWVRIEFPRQKGDRFLCIADYFKGKESGETDVVAFQIVTMGKNASEYTKKLYEANRYQDYLYYHGLSVETAEALAEYWHKVIRAELNIHQSDAAEIKKLFQQGYQGSRYSFGYPACPNLGDNAKVFEIFKPERIGIELTEEYQMVPEQTTNAIIIHHPEAKYFST